MAMKITTAIRNNKTRIGTQVGKFAASIAGTTMEINFIPAKITASTAKVITSKIKFFRVTNHFTNGSGNITAIKTNMAAIPIQKLFQSQLANIIPPSKKYLNCHVANFQPLNRHGLTLFFASIF